MTASPVGGNKDALAGNSGAVLLVKALTQVTVDNVELGVADSDQVKRTFLKVYRLTAPFAEKVIGLAVRALHRRFQLAELNWS